VWWRVNDAGEPALVTSGSRYAPRLAWMRLAALHRNDAAQRRSDWPARPTPSADGQHPLKSLR